MVIYLVSSLNYAFSNLLTFLGHPVQDTSPSFMEDIFVREDICHNMKCVHRLNVLRIISNKYEVKSLSFRGNRIWNLLPYEFEVVSSVSTFTEKIKSWKGSIVEFRNVIIGGGGGGGEGLVSGFAAGSSITIVALHWRAFECSEGGEHGSAGLMVGFGGYAGWFGILRDIVYGWAGFCWRACGCKSVVSGGWGSFESLLLGLLIWRWRRG